MPNQSCSNSESKQCFTPDQYPGQCVELSECNNLFRLRHKAPQTIDDRVYVTLSQCGFENGKPVVCCASNAPYPLRSLAGADVRPPPVVQRQTTSPRPPVSFMTRPPQTITNRPPVNSRSSDCAGIIDNRIYGGREAQINEMPFTAVLGYSRSKVGPCAIRTFWQNQFCSGPSHEWWSKLWILLWWRSDLEKNCADGLELLSKLVLDLSCFVFSGALCGSKNIDA